MPLKANWFPLHHSGDPWVSSGFSLPVLGWGCCLPLYRDPNSAVISRFPNSRSFRWSLWSVGTQLTLKPQAEYCQLPFSRQDSSMGTDRQSFVSSTGKAKERRFEGFPHSVPFCWCLTFRCLVAILILKTLGCSLKWLDAFVRGALRFVTVSFLKSKSKVTEGTNLYSASHWFRGAYKSSGRVSELALSFITEHCLALSLLGCVFSFAFALILLLG